jgi:hypothetical protein
MRPHFGLSTASLADYGYQLMAGSGCGAKSRRYRLRYANGLFDNHGAE